MVVACLIFDLDDTLCDYQKAMENAKNKVNGILQEVGVEPPLFWQIYHQVEPGLFKQFTEKKLTPEEYRFRRYADVLRDVHQHKTDVVDRLNTAYMGEANHNIQLFTDVPPFLQKMKESHVDLALLTNGPADGQRNKIMALGLFKYVEKIYISAEIGYAKPKKEAFQYVLDDLKLIASDVWMIGDSLEYDVEGANRVGIKGILLDRHNKYPDYTGAQIGSLLDLLDEEGRLIWR